MPPTEIAEVMKVPLEGVEEALRAMRTKHGRPARYAWNVPPHVSDKYVGETEDGEARWETMERIYDELEAWRSGALKH
jgi:hypothetical protein